MQDLKNKLTILINDISNENDEIDILQNKIKNALDSVKKIKKSIKDAEEEIKSREHKKQYHVIKLIDLTCYQTIN